MGTAEPKAIENSAVSPSAVLPVGRLLRADDRGRLDQARSSPALIRGLDAKSAPDRRRVLVVLGMHRSGTSAITRGLEALGASLGTDLLAEPAADNQRGHWEDRRVHTTNERLLESHGTAWWRFLTAEPSWDDDVSCRLKAEMARVLVDECKVGSTFGFKDPRTARLLGFWQQLFKATGCDDQYLLVVRNPLSVARSLAARDGMVCERAALLWLDYTLSAFVATNGRPRVVVDYDRWMKDTHTEARRVARALGFDWTEDTEAKFRGYAQDFLTPELRHQTASVEELELTPEIPPTVVRAFSLLRQLCVDDRPRDDAAIEDELGEYWETFQSLRPLWKWADRLEDTSFKAQQTSQDYERRAGETEQKRLQGEQLLQITTDAKVNLERQLKVTAEAKVNVEQQLQEQVRQIDRLAEQSAQAEQSRQQHERRAKEADEKRQQSEQLLQAAAAAKVSLEQKVLQLQEQLRTAVAAQAEAERHVQALELRPDEVAQERANTGDRIVALEQQLGLAREQLRDLAAQKVRLDDRLHAKIDQDALLDRTLWSLRQASTLLAKEIMPEERAAGDGHRWLAKASEEPTQGLAMHREVHAVGELLQQARAQVRFLRGEWGMAEVRCKQAKMDAEATHTEAAGLRTELGGLHSELDHCRVELRNALLRAEQAKAELDHTNWMFGRVGYRMTSRLYHIADRYPRMVSAMRRMVGWVVIRET